MKPFLLKPAIKDYIWGGTRLREEFGKESDLDRLAESWELSCHPDGEGFIASGELEGMSFAKFAQEHPEALGEKCTQFDTFPVLIKLIDARGNLSVQVHPDNDYARKYENDNGKTEMWYIVDCEEGAELIYGFKDKLTKELARSRGMLSNEKFLNNAKPEKVQEEKDKLAKYEQMMAQVEERLAQFK